MAEDDRQGFQTEFGGGYILFPEGRWVCKPTDEDTAKCVVLKDGITLRGAGKNTCFLEFQCADENSSFFEMRQDCCCAVMTGFTIIHNFLSQYIEPNALNFGKWCTFKVYSSNSKLKLDEVDITDINLNDGYEVGKNNYREAKNDYIALWLGGEQTIVEAQESNIHSSQWGIFNISNSSEIYWNGDIHSWMKSTGIHGKNSKIVVNGNIFTYGSGDFACCSCSGGHTIVNGNMFRICEIDNEGADWTQLFYLGLDDNSTIDIIGNCYTNGGICQAAGGTANITGNIYRLDNIYHQSSGFPMISVDSYSNFPPPSINIQGNVISECNDVAPLVKMSGRAEVRINGRSKTRGAMIYASSTVDIDNGSLSLIGDHEVVGDRAVRMYAGYLYVNGKLTYSKNHEGIQLIDGVKEVVLNGVFVKKNQQDLNQRGEELKGDDLTTGTALFQNYSATADVKVVLTNVTLDKGVTLWEGDSVDLFANDVYYCK